MRPSRLRVEDWDLRLRAFPYGHGSEQVDRHSFASHEIEFGEAEGALTAVLVSIFKSDHSLATEQALYPADSIKLLPQSNAPLRDLVEIAVRHGLRLGARPTAEIDARLAVVPMLASEVIRAVVKSQRFAEGTGVAAVVAASATSWALGVPVCCRNEFRQIGLLNQWVLEAQATGDDKNLRIWLAARMKIALRRTLAEIP